VITFSNTVLVGATRKTIGGEPATAGDGIGGAMSRLGKIIVYSLISATLGVIAWGIAQSSRQSDDAIVATLTAVIGGLFQGHGASWSSLPSRSSSSRMSACAIRSSAALICSRTNWLAGRFNPKHKEEIKRSSAQ
jgi:hypothetical protein